MKKIVLFIFLLIFTFNVNALEAYSENIVLYNLNDSSIIYEKNKDSKTSIASMTKIMTVLVAIENIDDISEKIKLTSDVFDGLKEANASVAGFYAGQVVTYEDLLYGAFLPSGADATNALAINIAGSVEDFVKLMNEKASSLNLSNTYFTNTTGLDEEGHYSTVNDIAILLKNALDNDIFKKIFMTKKYLTSDKSITFFSTLKNSLNIYNIDADYIIGGKTGYTLDAGRCLASTAYDEINDIYYLLVTSKAPLQTNYYHLLDAKNIYEYYFNNYKYFTLVDTDKIITTLKTKYAKEDKVDIKSSKTIKKYLKNDFDIDKIEYVYSGIQTVKYDVLPDTFLGTIDIKYENEIIESFDVLMQNKLHFSLFYFIKDNIIYIVLLLTAIILIFKPKKRKTR